MSRNIHEAREEGFTLIELLVVVIIIGILAAIAIPAFLSVRGNAGDATAQSDLRNAVIHFESYYTSNGNYTVANSTPLVDAGWEQSSDSTNLSLVGDGNDYCVVIQSSESSNYWAVTDDTNEPYMLSTDTTCASAAANPA